MILSDREIQAAIRDRTILIEPLPDETLYTSTALDLTLDGVLLRWKDQGVDESGRRLKLHPFRSRFNLRALMTDPNYSASVAIDPEEGYDLEPHKFVLGYTLQKIYLPNESRIAARVEGKSSLARLGVGVHVTAPTIHAGFGYNPDDKDHPGLPIQLEIFNVGNQIVVLDIGMPICQLILEEVREVPTRGYQGRFSAQRAFTLGSNTQN
jgi:dCTP deaminase